MSFQPTQVRASRLVAVRAGLLVAALVACGPGDPGAEAGRGAAASAGTVPRRPAASRDGTDAAEPVSADAAPVPLTEELAAAIADLDSEDRRVVDRAALALVVCDARFVPALTDRLAAIATDPERPRSARTAALFILGEWGEQAASTAPALGRLVGADRWLRPTDALVHMGPAGLAALTDALGADRTHEAHCAAASSLRWQRDRAVAAVPALVRVLRECARGRGQRAQSPEIIVPDGMDRPPYLGDEDRVDECRVAAAEALGEIGSPGSGAIEALVAALDSGDKALVGPAASALGGLGDAGVTVLVDRIATAHGWAAKSAIAWALADTTCERADVRSALVRASHDRDTSWHAVRGLAKLRTPESAAVMIEHLSDPHWKSRHLAIDTLGGLGDLASDAIPTLRELVGSAEENDPGHAIRALDRLGALSADDAERWLASADEAVRRTAAARLVRGVPVPELVRWLDASADPRCVASIDEIASRPAECEGAIAALARVAQSGERPADALAVKALGPLGPAAGPVLAELADRPMRRGANVFAALVATGWPGAAPALVRGLGRGNEAAGYAFGSSDLVPTGMETELEAIVADARLAAVVRHAAALGRLRTGTPMTDHVASSVLDVLTANLGEFGTLAEDATMLARFGPRARSVLPMLRFALRESKSEPERAAIAEAIRAIEVGQASGSGFERTPPK